MGIVETCELHLIRLVLYFSELIRVLFLLMVVLKSYHIVLVLNLLLNSVVFLTVVFKTADGIGFRQKLFR